MECRLDLGFDGCATSTSGSIYTTLYYTLQCGHGGGCHTGNRITGRMRHYSTSGVTSAQIPGLTLKGHPVCTLERLRAQGTRANRELLPPPPLSLSLELVALLRRDACLHASQQHEESNEASIIKKIHMQMKKVTKARLCELIPAAREKLSPVI